MRWIKENPTLAAGIGLPLVLMLIFAVAASIPTMLVDPPKYDVMYYGENYVSAKPHAKVNLFVSNGRLHAQYAINAQEYGGYNKVVYYYSARTGKTRQIDIVPPNHSAGIDWVNFDIPELSDLRLDTNLTSPDGYTFETHRRNYGAGELSGLFFMGSRYYHGPLLSKDGRAISIQPTANYYTGSNTKFLGWVVSE